MTTTNIALATTARLPGGMEDAAQLIATLSAAGARVSVVIWDDPDVEWANFDVVQLHSPWDYSDQPKKFEQWLDGLKTLDCTVVNSFELIKWNIDKRYLLDLADRGIPVPNTVASRSGATVSARELSGRFNDNFLVVKAAVGAGGRQVWRCRDAAEAVHICKSYLADRPVLIQRFEPVIESKGEYSAIYFDGELSHVVLKRAAPHEFRVQSHFGGVDNLAHSEPWMRDFGLSVLDALGSPPAYARVDFVASAPRNPLLMELELIEPDLFLRLDQSSFGKFAAILYQQPRRLEVAKSRATGLESQRV